MVDDDDDGGDDPGTGTTTRVSDGGNSHQRVSEEYVVRTKACLTRVRWTPEGRGVCVRVGLPVAEAISGKTRIGIGEISYSSVELLFG